LLIFGYRVDEMRRIYLRLYPQAFRLRYESSLKPSTGGHSAGMIWTSIGGLVPAAHAAVLPAEARALHRILQRPDIQSIITTFQTAHKQAVDAQACYKTRRPPPAISRLAA
jgi:hypothetical protein